MEAIKLKGIAHNGSLTLQVRQHFDERELEVFIYIADEKKDDANTNDSLQHQGKIEELMRIVSSAKHPDFPVTKYDVYEQ